jgi:hypothetical protein
LLQAKSLPLGRLAVWPDASGNQHTLRQPVTSRQPVISSNPSYYGPAVAAVFSAASAQSMAGGSDAYDLGILGNFSLYFVGRSYTSTPQWIAGRGSYDYFTPELQGWQFLVASDPWNPSPGSIGARVVTSGGQAAGVYTGNGHSYQTFVYGFVAGDFAGGQQGWPNPPYYIDPTPNTDDPFATTDPLEAVYWPFQASFKTKDMLAFSSAMNQASPVFTRGFPWTSASGMDATGSDFSNFSDAVAVTYGRTPDGAPVPPIDSNLAFRVGGSAQSVSSGVGNFQGEMFSLVIYRAAHNAAQRQAVISWLSAYYGATCASIVVPNAANSGSCSGAIREAWCYQTCNAGTVQLSGYVLLRAWFGACGIMYFLHASSERCRFGTHWCGPGTWDWAPLICKNQCPDSSSPPTNVVTCNKTVVSIGFTGQSDMRWFIAFPQTPDSLRDAGWVQNAAAGFVQSNAGQDCGNVPATILGIHPNNWDVVIPVGQPAQASVLAQPLTATTAVAVIWRLQGATTFFNLSFSWATGVTLSRSISGSVFVLGVWYNASVLGVYIPGTTWVTLQV